MGFLVQGWISLHAIGWLNFCVDTVVISSPKREYSGTHVDDTVGPRAGIRRSRIKKLRILHGQHDSDTKLRL